MSRNIRDCIKHDPPNPGENPFFPEFLIETTKKAYLQVREAHFVLCNTVEELEPETISDLNHKQNLPAYAVGPTNFLARTPPPSSIRSAVDCSEWLDSKPPRSVLFIAFGSVAPTEQRVIWEIADGLNVSGAHFLWVLRPDSVIIDGDGDGDGDGDVLPPFFEEKVAGRGLIVPWCDQRRVLSSPAVGGFLTHCGWSSILESMWFGVPMICYPIFSDQPNNRNLVVYDWKIGINLCDEEEISREEVVEKIGKLMGGSEGEKVRMEMKKVSKIVHNALAHNGSSEANLNKFLKDLKKKIWMLEK